MDEALSLEDMAMVLAGSPEACPPKTRSRSNFEAGLCQSPGHEIDWGETCMQCWLTNSTPDELIREYNFFLQRYS